MKQVNIKKRICLLILIFSVLLFRLYHLSDIYGPIIFDDEMGYWTHAANFAGFEWTNTEASWYSYGYSLILAPLFLLSHNMHTVYRIAIVINALLGGCQFLLGVQIIKELDDEIPWQINYGISFVAACFSGYIFQSYIGWAETFLYTWTLFTIWGFLKFTQKPGSVRTALVTCQILFAYIIHNRSIVIVIAFAMVLVWMGKRKVIERKQILLAVAILLAGYFINGQMREFLEAIVWPVETISFSGNDLATGSGRMLTQLSSLKGILGIFESVLNKLWGMMAQTCLLAYFGFSYLVKKIKLCIRNKHGNICFYLFILLYTMGTIATCAIAMNPHITDYSEKVRIDPYFYTRYSDSVTGILIILGLMNLYLFAPKKKMLLESLLGGILFLAAAVALYVQIRNITLWWINTPCVPGLYLFSNFDLKKITMAAMCMGIFLIGISAVRKELLFMVMLLGFVVVNVHVSDNAFSAYVQPGQNSYGCYESLFACINALNGKYPIYIQRSGDESWYMVRQHARIHMVDEDVSFEPIDADNVLILIPAESFDETIARYPDSIIVKVSGPVMVLAYGDDLILELEEKGLGYVPAKKENIDTLGAQNYELAVAETKVQKRERQGLTIEVEIKSTNEKYLLNEKRVNLSYHIYDMDGNCVLYDGERYTIDRFAGTETVEVTLDAATMLRGGTYTIVFELVEEGVAWYESLGGDTASVVVEF
jgi:hypothetical protein